MDVVLERELGKSLRGGGAGCGRQRRRAGARLAAAAAVCGILAIRWGVGDAAAEAGVKLLTMVLPAGRYLRMRLAECWANAVRAQQQAVLTLVATVGGLLSPGC